MSSIASVTPTLCALFGVAPPRDSGEKPIDYVLFEAEKRLGGKISKALIYAPDAVGEGLYRDFQSQFVGVRKVASLEVEMKSIIPTWTPVCFSSMFTGAQPAVHGIKKYEKPVLAVDTLFDALTRAGKKVAIVAVKGSSIDLVFRNRKIDYYTEEYDPQVEARVLNILKLKDYDLILVYHQEYDDMMHDSTPRDPKALEAFRRHLKSFETIAAAFNDRYAAVNRAVVFAPDHGTHIDPTTGKGTHGTDSPDDMDVRHFWGISRGQA
jgi:predicted AlkP superfamily pyrophosphatase or phosphodiesterase